MHSTMTTLLAAASLVAAMPTQELQSRAEPDYAYILDPWNQVQAAAPAPAKLKRDSPILKEILERATPDLQNTKDFRGFIPGCDIDPSLVEKDTAYAVDQGVKIPKNGDNDECTTGHKSSHCWTEYFLVEAAIEYVGWKNTAAAIDCATTSSCTSASIGFNQTCTVTGSSTSNGWDWKVIDLTLKLDYEKKPLSGGGSAGFAVTHTHSETETSLTQSCVSISDNQACSWDDKACHQVWYADRNLHVWGQIERVCNGPSDGTQQSTQRPNGGPYVRGQKGFELTMPVNKLVGCGALCGDLTYNFSLPENEARSPYIKPSTWA
jgi:hypothetical protein